MKNLYFIKFGGSLITDKKVPYTRRDEVIRRCVADFVKVQQSFTDALFILGNGAGSYGHYAAIEKNIHETVGFAFVQQKVKELNAYIVEQLIDKGVAAMSIHQSSILTASNGALRSLSIDSLVGLLNVGMTPVLYGDIVYDDKKLCHIFSTEDLFDILIKKLADQYAIKKVIFETTVDGFLDSHNRVISLVNQTNWQEVKQNVLKTDGYDVTGGMKHKIEKALEYTKKNIVTHIVNGREPHILERVLVANEDVGTKIGM